MLAPLRREVDRLTEHSQTLNKIAWAIAEALGDAPPGVDVIEADLVEMTERLIDTLWRRTAQLESARADADAAHAELEQAHGLIHDLRTGRYDLPAEVFGRQGDIS